MPETNTLSHTTWNCKYHIVFAPKYRRKVSMERKGLRLEIFFVNCVVGKELASSRLKFAQINKIQEYIKNQLAEDQASDQLTLDMSDPFMGSR